MCGTSDIIKHGLRVLGKGVLRDMFGAKGEEVTCDCRRLHNEELKDLYYCYLPDIIYVTKSRTMRWAGLVARIGKKKAIQDFGGKNSTAVSRIIDIGVDAG